MKVPQPGLDPNWRPYDHDGVKHPWAGGELEQHDDW
jgi:hypothetical protein